MFNYSTPSLADIAAVTGNGNNGGFGDGNGWWVLIILFALFGGWGRGYGNEGGFGGGSSGISENYTLASDMANLSRQISDTYNSTERKLDSISNGLCDGFYTQAQLVNGTNQLIQQNGYESRLATTTLGSQVASCCCDLKQAIGETNYNIATQANGINTAIERGFANTNFAMAQNNCATLTAIDKVGDRVIDYLAKSETDRLRSENEALRLAASQARQNQYLLSELKPCPQPAFVVPNPNCCYQQTGCGCSI